MRRPVRPAGERRLPRGAARKPAIPGLTDALVDLDDDEWRRAVARLREVRLLAPLDPSAPTRSTPIRWCANGSASGCEQTNEAAWKAAHGRLYEHLRDTTQEGKTPTLADLAPLYQAIAHGCRAGRHQEALDEVYVDRICRRQPDGRIEFYASQQTGRCWQRPRGDLLVLRQALRNAGRHADAGGPGLGARRGQLRLARARALRGGAAGDARGAANGARRRRIGAMRRSARPI